MMASAAVSTGAGAAGWQGLTREAVVVAVCELVVEHDGHGVVLVLELRVERLDLVLGHLEARPAVPLERRRLGEPAQPADQAARGHGHVVLSLVGALDGNGQAVRDQQQAALLRLGALQLGWRHLGVSVGEGVKSGVMQRGILAVWESLSGARGGEVFSVMLLG
jgi:hypothetical protein